MWSSFNFDSDFSFTMEQYEYLIIDFRSEYFPICVHIMEFVSALLCGKPAVEVSIVNQ